jgi:hypothetical protein
VSEAVSNMIARSSWPTMGSASTLAPRARSRVTDSLAVYKDAEGSLEVEQLSNLTEEEAIEVGSKVAALIGLGIEGEDGMEAGAAAGAEAAAEDGLHPISGDEQLWDVLEDIPNDTAAALVLIEHHWGGAAARRDRTGRRLPHRGRLHQPTRPDRDRPGHAGGGGRAPRPRPVRRGSRAIAVVTNESEDHMFGSRRVARRTGRRTARRVARRRG